MVTISPLPWHDRHWAGHPGNKTLLNHDDRWKATCLRMPSIPGPGKGKVRPLHLAHSMTRTLSLYPFPASSPSAGSIRVDLQWASDGSLHFDFLLAGFTGLRIPPAREACARDGLWQHTCCEAFIANAGETAYREFNFSPSGEWAIYDFSSYRQPAARAISRSPAIKLAVANDGFRLSAHVDRSELPTGAQLQLGLCCVLESEDGSKSYWAAKHTAAQPDFHQRNSFIITLDRP